MDRHLTEISNSYLFSEYLQCLGIVAPKLKENWEYSRDDRVLARVTIGQEGRARFYIAAAMMSTKHCRAS